MEAVVKGLGRDCIRAGVQLVATSSSQLTRLEQQPAQLEQD